MRPRRAAAWAALVVAVAVAHGCVVDRAGGYFSALSSGEPMPERMKAVYVRSMEATEPVAVAPTAPAPRRRRAPVTAVEAAPEPEAAASAASEPAEPPPEPASATSAPMAEAASAPVVAPAETAASAPPFEWPVATRVTYVLTGYFRGEVHGTAQVEWVREDDRYQVHLDVFVGLQVAPLMSRRMTSEGRITPEGLKPERYDQVTKMAFSSPYRAVVRLAPDHVVLANGQRRASLPGLQDTASQFIQLAWQFSTQPGSLKPGAVIDVPLALPRAVSVMRYDVSEPEMLWTPFGEVPVMRLKPRQAPRAGGDLSVEMWIAPQYRHLPIRLRIHQDAETFVDLMITKPPELGG